MQCHRYWIRVPLDVIERAIGAAGGQTAGHSYATLPGDDGAR